MNIEIKNKLYGEFRARVYQAEDLDEQGNPKEDAQPRVDTGFVPNLLTDYFFETVCGGLFSAGGLTQYIQCGTGTAAPTNGDTSITPLGPRAVVFSRNWANVGNEITCTTEYRFGQGAIVGTVSEVGVFQGSTGGNTSMRSLIKDVGGTPTTITLTSIDYLYITWRVKATVNLSDQTGTVSIGGVSYNYTLRPCAWNAGLGGTTSINPFCPLNHTSYNTGSATNLTYLVLYGSQTLGSVTGVPSVAEGSVVLETVNPTISAYVSNSKQRKLTWSVGDSQGNIAGGFGSLAVYSISTFPATGGYQISFSAVSGGGKIPKDNTKTFTFSLTFTWSR